VADLIQRTCPKCGLVFYRKKRRKGTGYRPISPYCSTGCRKEADRDGWDRGPISYKKLRDPDQPTRDDLNGYHKLAVDRLVAGVEEW